MKILDKEILSEMIQEFISIEESGQRVGGTAVMSNEPIVNVRNYDPTNNLKMFEEETERIVELLHDLNSSIRGGLKSGDVSPGDGQKIVDFQVSRIQLALTNIATTIDAHTGGDDLDMTTPEV